MLRIHATPLFRTGVFLLSLAGFLWLGATLFDSLVFVVPDYDALISGRVPDFTPAVFPLLLFGGIMGATAFACAGIVTDLLCGIPSAHEID